MPVKVKQINVFHTVFDFIVAVVFMMTSTVSCTMLGQLGRSGWLFGLLILWIYDLHLEALCLHK